MALPAKIGQYRFELDGKTVNAPLEWKDIKILATFDNEATQANISTDEFTFVRDELADIYDYILKGLTGGNGIFEGLPFNISAFNKDNDYLAFKGFLNLADGLEYDEARNRIKSKIKKASGLNEFSDGLEALSYGYLEKIGIFSNSDYLTIDYVEEKKINAFEILVSAIILYLMVKELVEGIKDISTQVGTTVGMISTSTTGINGAIIYAIAIGLVLSAYTTIMLETIIDLTEDLIKTLIPPRRKAKVLSLRTALEKVANKLGYNFESNIEDLSNVYYLPSNIDVDETDERGFISKTKGTPRGIPNVTDYGYTCSEMFELVKNLFDGKYAIVDNKLVFYNRYDDYWIRTSTYQMPKMLPQPRGFNTDELAANRLLQFQTDITDEWTIDNFPGTNYEVITDAITVDRPQAKYIKGADTTNFILSLGTRKDKLNDLEEFLKDVLGAVDEIIEFFGGSGNYAARVKGKVGLLKVSNNNYSNPKLLRLSGGKMPANHRDLFSAKYLYNNYHYGKSFVQNNYFGQKITYTGVRIGFGFEDFLKVIENSYFVDSNGKIGKIVKLEWQLSSDTAIVDYWIREPYTKNLQEITVEP